jgi:hypothetical protein
MTNIASGIGHSTLSKEGKQLVALSMYSKGKLFIGSATIARKKSTSEAADHVFLHLLCQGIEVMLKGLLLLANYDHYINRLRRPIGHNLNVAASEVTAAYGLKSLSAKLDNELSVLSALYSKHLLRYGNGYDVLVDPRTIPRQLVVRRIAAVVRLAERDFTQSTAIGKYGNGDR